MRHSLLIAVFTFLLSSLCLANQIKLQGFVTAVHSSTSFEIDDYKISDETSLGEKNGKSRVEPGKPVSLRIGLELEVKGDYNRATGEVKAQEIKVLSDDENVAGSGLVENKASLKRDARGWSGTLVADGEILTVTPDTVITAKRSKTGRQQRSVNEASDENVPLSPEEIGLDTFAHYAGARQPDDSILTKRIEFEQDTVDADEARAWKQLAARLDYSDSQTGAGKLTIDETERDMFPCPEAQEYLTKIGMRLVPPYQRELSDSDPLKIQFRFFLIDTDTMVAGAYPNGIVVVSAHVFDVLDNEAQLAFMLSHEMARAVEKQAWRAYRYRRGERVTISLAGAAASMFTYGAASLGTTIAERRVLNDFSRQLETQADRAGLAYMFAAGYDPREAPEVWRAIARNRADRDKRLFWSHHTQNFTHRSYLEAELNLRYGKEELSTFKKNTPEFKSAADAIKSVRQRGKSKAK
jgi:hypothetical protein